MNFSIYRQEVQAMRSRLVGYLVFLVLAFSAPLKAQIEPIPTLKVQPIPLPGGDIIPPTPLPGGGIFPSYGLYNQFFPGPPNQTPPFDPINADPHGITNFRGVTAMGYTSGPATDNSGTKYTVITDIRVYQGEYVGGEIADANTAGATRSARARGTFVEI
jgi:hypothetical protein